MAAPATLPVADSWVRPRAAMRHVLSLRPGEAERLMMVGVAAAASGIQLAVAIGVAGDAPVARMAAEITPAGRIAVALLGTLLQYVVVSALVGWLGRAFGGGADAAASRTVVAWWMMVVGIASAAGAVVLSVLPLGLLTIFELAVLLASLLMLAGMVAEAHGFESTGRVATVTLSVAAALLLLVTGLAGGGAGR